MKKNFRPVFKRNERKKERKKIKEKQSSMLLYSNNDDFLKYRDFDMLVFC